MLPTTETTTAAAARVLLSRLKRWFAARADTGRSTASESHAPPRDDPSSSAPEALGVMEKPVVSAAAAEPARAAAAPAARPATSFPAKASAPAPALSPAASPTRPATPSPAKASAPAPALSPTASPARPATPSPATTAAPAPAATPSPAGDSIAQYRIEHVVSRGDRTTVYRAVERASGNTVALKTVLIGAAADSDRGLWRERFLREAEAARRLNHEHIVRVHAAGVQGQGDAATGWMAMDWVGGTDLTRYATPARLLPEPVVLGICARVALALDHAHRQGVVHRDIKAANVLFDPTSGQVKVTDFGSARLADALATRSGVLAGTPAYMSPEQLSGAPAVPQGDFYALGVLLFELLVGHRPFEAESMGELLSDIARRPAPRLSVLRPELPEVLDEIVARLLAKRPEERHATGRMLAVELRLALEACQRPMPVAATAEWADTQPVEWPETPAPQGPPAPAGAFTAEIPTPAQHSPDTASATEGLRGKIDR